MPDTPLTGQDDARRALATDDERREALRRWREREMRFPAFTRRMKPDELDFISGAWDRILAATLRADPLPQETGESDG